MPVFLRALLMFLIERDNPASLKLQLSFSAYFQAFKKASPVILSIEVST